MVIRKQLRRLPRAMLNDLAREFLNERTPSCVMRIVLENRLSACVGVAARLVEAPAHLRPVADADAWHRERQAGRPLGLALFDHEPHTQGKLL